MPWTSQRMMSDSPWSVPVALHAVLVLDCTAQISVSAACPMRFVDLEPNSICRVDKMFHSARIIAGSLNLFICWRLNDFVCVALLLQFSGQHGLSCL